MHITLVIAISNVVFECVRACVRACVRSNVRVDVRGCFCVGLSLRSSVCDCVYE